MALSTQIAADRLYGAMDVWDILYKGGNKDTVNNKLNPHKRHKSDAADLSVFFFATTYEPSPFLHF